MPRLYARIPEKYDIDRVEYEGECPLPGQVRWLIQDGGSLVAYESREAAKALGLSSPIMKHTWAYATPKVCAQRAANAFMRRLDALCKKHGHENL